MLRLQDTEPLRHALIWIAIYVVAANVGDLLGEQLRFPGTTSVVLVLTSVGLLAYLRAGRRFVFYGVTPVPLAALAPALYLLPLFAITFVQYGNGFAADLDTRSVVFAILLVAAVGFIEELLFRGFLLRALRARGTVTRAILISGVTFGIGHLVNLLRGYSAAEQSLQLVAAILIGIALAYCAVLTGSILLGVAFHALFDLSGTLTQHSVEGDLVTVGVTALVVVPYILFLRNRLAAVGPASVDLRSPVAA